MSFQNVAAAGQRRAMSAPPPSHPHPFTHAPCPSTLFFDVTFSDTTTVVAPVHTQVHDLHGRTTFT